MLGYDIKSSWTAPIIVTEYLCHLIESRVTKCTERFTICMTAAELQSMRAKFLAPFAGECPEYESSGSSDYPPVVPDISKLASCR